MSARSTTGYTPLSQDIVEDDVGEVQASSSKPTRHRIRPGSIDLKKLDNAFKRLEFYKGIE